MKTVTAREFYHNAGLVDGLSKGKPKFIVTRSARPRMTRALAEKLAVSGGKGRFDGAAFLQSLKK